MVPETGPRVLQSKWPFDASHSWNNWFYYNKKKNNTREGEGRNILYRDATLPCLSQTGKLFYEGQGEEKRKATHRCQVGRSPVRQSLVCRQFLKKEKAATPFALLKKQTFHAPPGRGSLARSQTLGGSRTFLFCHSHRTVCLLFVSTALHIPRRTRDESEKKKKERNVSAFSQLARRKASLCATLSPSKTRRADPLGRGGDSPFFPVATEATESFFFFLSLSSLVKAEEWSGEELKWVYFVKWTRVHRYFLAKSAAKRGQIMKSDQNGAERREKELEWTRAKHVKQRVNEQTNELSKALKGTIP